MNEFEISPEEFEKLEDLSERKNKVMSWLSKHNMAILRGLDPKVFHGWVSAYSYIEKDKIPRLEKMCEEIKKQSTDEQFFSKKELRKIISWKLAFDPRRQQRLLNSFEIKETDELIRDKTKIIFDENVSAEEKVHKIGGHGGGRLCNQCFRAKITSVGIPVASTILRFIDPSKYAIIDQKAMDALHKLKFKDLCERKQWGTQLPQYRFEPYDYRCYLELITEISRHVNLSPCQVDMALWQSEQH